DRYMMHDVVQNTLVRSLSRAELFMGKLKDDIADDIEVRADRTLVSKILDNLINNALVYSDHPPMVRVTGRRDGDQVAITVVDDGIGISSQDRSEERRGGEV